MAIPVVSTSISGIPELVTSGENGLLMPERDPSAFSSSLESVIRDRDLARRLGADGRRTVSDRFSSDVTAVKLSSLFWRPPMRARAPGRLLNRLRALVTGVAGFIGSQLSESLLDEGWDVQGVDSFSDYYETWIKERNLAVSQENARFSFVRGDLADIDAEPLVDDVDYVFHLAARAGVRSSWGASFDQYLRDNLLATQRLLEACKGRKVKKLIFASSSSVYGDAAAFPIEETVKPQPISPYGLTKLAAENLCRLYGQGHQVASVSLRFLLSMVRGSGPTWLFMSSVARCMTRRRLRSSVMVCKAGSLPTLETSSGQ